MVFAWILGSADGFSWIISSSFTENDTYQKCLICCFQVSWRPRAKVWWWSCPGIGRDLAAQDSADTQFSRGFQGEPSAKNDGRQFGDLGDGPHLRGHHLWRGGDFPRQPCWWACWRGDRGEVLLFKHEDHLSLPPTWDPWLPWGQQSSLSSGGIKGRIEVRQCLNLQALEYFFPCQRINYGWVGVCQKW